MPVRSISKSLPPSVIVRVEPVKDEAVITSFVTLPSTSEVRKPLFATNASTASSSRVVSIVERSIEPLNPPPVPVKSRSVPLSSTRETTPSEPPPPSPVRSMSKSFPPSVIVRVVPVKDEAVIISFVILPSTSAIK